MKTELLKKLDLAKKNLEEAQELYIQIEKDKQKMKEVTFKELLAGIIDESDCVNFSGEYMRVYRPRKEDGGRKDEIFSIGFNRDYNFELGVREGFKMKMNYYTTSETSEYQYKRLVVLGQMAQFILNNEKMMIGMYEKIETSFNLKWKASYLLKNECSKAVKDLQDMISKFDRDEFMKELKSEEGVSFANKVHVEKSLSESFGQVTKIRIVGQSKSGKKLNVEITQVYQQYDYKADKAVDRTYLNVVEILTSKINSQLSFFMNEKKKENESVNS